MRILGAMVALVGLLALMAPAWGQVDSADVYVTVDDLGHGTIHFGDGISGPLPWGTTADTGPGGLESVLFYSLLEPPELIWGDLLLIDAESEVTELIRFSDGDIADGISPTALTPGLFYYRGFVDGLVDPEFPSELYDNVDVVELEDLGGGVMGGSYTPAEGAPGFVSGFLVHYLFVNGPTGTPDVPEPSAFAFLLSGGAGFGTLALRRRLRK